MINLVIAIMFILILIFLLYTFLFWVIKQYSSVIYEYDEVDKESKKGIFFGFVLYSGFIIAPSYGIMVLIIKLFQLIYN